MPPYPTPHQIEEIFSHRDNPSVFNTHLADNVDVSVVGVDFIVAGNHRSPQAFHDNVWGRLTAVLELETLRIEVRRVIGGGESAWAAVESSATARAKTGEPLHNNFVDLVRFNSQGKIAQMKEFFDSEHVHRHVDAHEKKQKKQKQEKEKE